MIEPTSTNKWLDLTASEVMDSVNAKSLITCAVDTIKGIIGIPDKILCIGCADGTELKLWNTPYGIDMNDESVKMCQEQGFHVDKMDMHHMLYDDNSFDLVFARDVFEHAYSSIQAISEFARVTSKYVSIIVPGEDWQSSNHHFIIPTLKQMISLGEKVGLVLRAYREYCLSSGKTNIWQHLYIFQKL